MRKLANLLTLGAVLATLIFGQTAAALLSSSHREAPLISQDPLADNTDVYAFVSPDNPSAVTIIATYIPFEEPAGGPNFNLFGESPAMQYEIHIDNVGDAEDHIVYRFSFVTNTKNKGTFLYNTGMVNSLNDATLNVTQVGRVERVDIRPNGNRQFSVLGTDLPVAPANVGPASMPNYAALSNAAISTLSDGSKVFFGPVADPFFVDLGAVFDLLTIRPGAPGNNGGGKNGLAGYNVHAIAIQVPITRLTSSGRMPTGVTAPDAIIGLWATSRRLDTRISNPDGSVTYTGNPVQISRLANPLINEVIIPRQFKDRWNSSHPRSDSQFGLYVTDPEPARLLHALYGLNVPPAPRSDLVAVFLTGIPGLTMPMNVKPAEEMRLNVAVPPSANPNRLGVLGGDLAGFPNGRRLADDVTDIELQALAGATPFTPAFNVAPNNQLGDGVNTTDVPFRPAFPYLALPYQGFANSHGK